MTKAHQPHDKFFKALFGTTRIAKQFLEACLPEDILELIDLETLTAMPTHFIWQHRASHTVDLLYQACLRETPDALMYFLFEHLHQPDPYVQICLEEYQLDVIKHHRQQNQSQTKQKKPNRRNLVPVVLPLVVYTGLASWRGPRDFDRLYGPQAELAKRCIQHAPLFVDVQRTSDAALFQQQESGLAQFAFKCHNAPDLGQYFDTLLSWIRSLEMELQIQDYSVYKAVVHYLMGTIDKQYEPVLQEKIQFHQTTLRGEIMTTIAEKWFDDGLQKGIAQGRKEGVQRIQGVAKKLLGKGLGPEEVAETTGLSLEMIQSLSIDLQPV